MTFKRSDSRALIFERSKQRQQVRKVREVVERGNRLAAQHEEVLQAEIDRRKQIVGEVPPEGPTDSRSDRAALKAAAPKTPDALKDSGLLNAKTGLTYRHEHYLSLLMEWGLYRPIISACVYSGTATPLMLMGLADSVAATVSGIRDPRVALSEREAASAILRILSTREVRMAIAKVSAAVVSDGAPRKEKADIMRDLWTLRETIRAQYRLEEDEALKPNSSVQIVGEDGGGPVGRT